MYKNFNLTESEREQILNMHKTHGYKKPLNEQSYSDDMEMEDDNELHPTFDGDGKFIGMSKPMSFVDDEDSHQTFDGDNKFIGMSKSMGDMEPDSYELEEIDMAQPSEDETKVEKLLNYFGFKKYKVLHDGDLVVYDNGQDTYNVEIRLVKNSEGPYARILYHGPEFGNPDNMVDEVLVKGVPVKVGDDRFPMAIEDVLKKVKAIKEYNESKPLREEEIDEQEVSDINEGFGRDISVQMAIWSHLSDIEYDSPEQRKIRCNFIKLLVAKYIPKDVEVNEDKLDALYDQVSNRDFSGSALEDSEMGDMNEQTQDFPGDDDKQMMLFVDNELLDFGFKKEKVHSSGVRSMCKTYYTTGGFDNNAFLMLRCCGPNDSGSSAPGKCGHVVVGIKKNGTPQMVKSINVNGFAMDSNDGTGKPMFNLDLNKLKLATKYALQLKTMLQKQFDAKTT
jgi:hypothetical protein